ncbi:MAG: hypothetical protein NVSMB64_28060 [Candidatus Velthaea sp.]
MLLHVSHDGTWDAAYEYEDQFRWALDEQEQREQAAIDAIAVTIDEARDVTFAKWGELHTDIAAPLISSRFNDGARWPGTNEGYRRVDESDRVIYVSSGVADPFDYANHETDLGFQCELAIMCLQQETPPGLTHSWALEILQSTTEQALRDGDFVATIQKFVIFTIGLQAPPIAARWVDEEQRCYVAIGDSRRRLRLPAGEAMVIGVQLISPEQQARLAGSEDERVALDRRWEESPDGWLSKLAL